MSGHPSHRTRTPKTGERREDFFVYGRDTIAAKRHFTAIQRGKCAICRRKSSKLVLDHEHSDIGLIRGLICATCNSGLGMFADDRDTLAAAILYLDAHDDRNTAYLDTDDFEERTVKTYRFALSDVDRAARDDRVRRDFRQCVTVDKLVEKYGLSKSTIYEIVYGGEDADHDEALADLRAEVTG